jgi:hypothetical protein
MIIVLQLVNRRCSKHNRTLIPIKKPMISRTRFASIRCWNRVASTRRVDLTKALHVHWDKSLLTYAR